MAPPALPSQVAVAFWFLVACSVQKGQSVESPQPLASFLGGKPGSSSLEQLVPGSLTVLSPRKKKKKQKPCFKKAVSTSRDAKPPKPPKRDGNGVCPCSLEGIFLLVCGYPAGSTYIPPLPMLSSSGFCICLVLHKHSVESFRETALQSASVCIPPCPPLSSNCSLKRPLFVE